MQEGNTIWHGYRPLYKLEDDSLLITLESGKQLHVNDLDPEEHYYVRSELFMDKSGGQMLVNLNHIMKVSLRPIMFRIRFYKRDECLTVEDIYPESTGQWYGRMKIGRQKALYLIQETEDNSRPWITIMDPETGEIFESHRIHLYEAEALIPDPDQWGILEKTVNPQLSRESTLTEFLDDCCMPSVDDILDLLAGAEIPHIRFGGFRLGENIRETLSQIVPESWTKNVREEVMAFLSYLLTKPKETKEDPIEFLERFNATPTLRFLIMLHQSALLAGAEPIQYVRRFWEYDTEAKHTHAFSVIGRPDIFEVFTVPRIYPRYTEFLTEIEKLVKEKTILMGLPYTKRDAKRSRHARSIRIQFMLHNVHLLGRVRTETLGLSRLFYMGRAYRWPHRHLAYTMSLNGEEERPLLLHEIIAPPVAVQRMRRKEGWNILETDWYHRAFNVKHFSVESRSWTVKPQKIADALSSECTETTIRKRLKVPKSVGCFSNLDILDIKVLDILAQGLPLSTLEIPKHLDSVYGLTLDDIRNSVTKLTAKGVFSPIYTFPTGHPAILVVADPSSPQILSMAREFSRQMVSVMIAKTVGGSKGNNRKNLLLMLGNAPRADLNWLLEELPAHAAGLDLNVECYRVSPASTYRRGLFERLWKGEDGWDDDVSGLLSQMRS